MNEKPEIAEDDLHAYLDGALDPARAAVVAAHLEADPALKAEVEGWRAQDAALRALFTLYATGDQADLPPVPRRGRGWLGAGLAAGLALAFILGGGAGFWLRDALAPPPVAASRVADAGWLAQAAGEVFLTYVREVRHPVEVGAEEREHLATWLGNRIDKPFTAPELALYGFELVGGRLLPIGGLPGAMLMYENAQGDRMTVLLARNLGARDTAFQFSQVAGVNTLRWVDGPIAYAISAFLDRPALETVSRAIYAHFEDG